jgi:hypothetical protein
VKLFLPYEKEKGSVSLKDLPFLSLVVIRNKIEDISAAPVILT